jgi:hypothetical protein
MLSFITVAVEFDEVSARLKADFTIRNGGDTLNALRRALRPVDFLAALHCCDDKASAALHAARSPKPFRSILKPGGAL